MATGEIVDDESLGGAGNIIIINLEMHNRISGVSDFFAKTEIEGIKIAREIVKNLNYKKLSKLPKQVFLKIDEPIYDRDELLGIIQENIRIPFEAREVVARIVDGSRFLEFKPLYGTTILCCEAKIMGFPIGIIANNGVLFSESSNKATQFIQLCNQRDLPILFLQNITGKILII
jgi:acetyl-CoA carboxylase carboxyltransferase component